MTGRSKRTGGSGAGSTIGKSFCHTGTAPRRATSSVAIYHQRSWHWATVLLKRNAKQRLARGRPFFKATRLRLQGPTYHRRQKVAILRKLRCLARHVELPDAARFKHHLSGKWRNPCGNPHDVVDLDLRSPLADERLGHALELAHVKSQVRDVNVVANFMHFGRKEDSAHRTALIQSVEVAQLGNRLPGLVEYHDLIGLICDYPQPIFFVEEHPVGAIDAVDENLRLASFPVNNRHPDDLVVARVPHKQGGLGAIKREAVCADGWNTVGNQQISLHPSRRGAAGRTGSPYSSLK